MKIWQQILGILGLCTLWMVILGGVGRANSDALEQGIVTGRVMVPEDMLPQEMVFLLFDVAKGPPPQPENYFRLPDEGGPVSIDGYFKMRAPVGNYWYGVIKMPEGKESRMPTFDDWLYVSRRSGNEMATLQVWPGEITDIGELEGLGEFYVPGQRSSSIVTLTGSVFRAGQKPLPGIVVEAFAPGANERALFSSDTTLQNGSYSLRVPPGSYSLKLRFPQPLAVNGKLVRPSGHLDESGSADIVVHAEDGIVQYDFHLN